MVGYVSKMENLHKDANQNAVMGCQLVSKLIQDFVMIRILYLETVVVQTAKFNGPILVVELHLSAQRNVAMEFGIRTEIRNATMEKLTKDVTNFVKLTNHNGNVIIQMVILRHVLLFAEMENWLENNFWTAVVMMQTKTKMMVA